MSSAITQMAMAVIAKEQAEKRAKEQAELQAAIASREAEERSVMLQRVALEAERLMAAKEAERLVAEERAARAREAEELALRAEIERLRNRSETEILRDEVASLRAEMATLRRAPPNEIANLRDEMATLRRMTPTKEVVQESIYSHLRADGELDMRFRSSKQELSVVQQEVAELKSQMASLLKGGFRIHSGSLSGGLIANAGPHLGICVEGKWDLDDPRLTEGQRNQGKVRQTWYLDPI
jgi:hypothetical protein